MTMDELYQDIMQTSKKSGGGRAVAGHGPEHGMASNALKALHVPGFKKGGKVKKTGIYKLHKGETVIPTGKNGCKCGKDSSAAMTE